jgi:hypothetical protein
MKNAAWIGAVWLAILLPVAAMAGSEPSFDVLVPYFEVEFLQGDQGRTTLLAVANHSPQATEFRAAVHTNWGIEVLGYSFTLAPNAVHTANLRDWVLFGRLPDGRVLGAQELAHLQAALSGQPSPRDQRWYSTEVEPGLAVGYVTFAAQGTPGHHPFWGDYYIVDSDLPLEQGDTLVNLDLTVDEDLPCRTHVIRFLEVPPEVLSTELMIWTPTAAQPAAQPALADRWRVPVRIDVYDEAGRRVKRLDLRLLPVERLPICDVCWEVPFGWMEIRTPVDSAVTGHVSTVDDDSLALHSYCVPAEKDVFEGPAIDIEKLVNGEDADSPPGPAIALGEPVLWTYEVTNVGSVALSDVVVSDDRGVLPVCPLDALEPQESMTCTAQGTAAVCEQRNLATVTAVAADGALVSDEDPAYYTGQPHAALGIEKRTNGQDADTPPGPSIQAGQAVTWTYLVTNTGDVSLTQVAVTDDKQVAVNCPKAQLQSAESMTCSGAGTAVAGQYANLGTAVGQPPCGPPVTASDPSHYLGWQLTARIDIEKRVNGEDADTPPGPQAVVGSTLAWTYAVANAGGVELTNVRVSDDQGLAVGCPKAVLAPGESMTCTASSLAAAGQHRNVATAIGTPPSGPDVQAADPANYLGLTPAIDIEKLVNGLDADTPPGPSLAVGSAIAWTYRVANVGDVPLADVKVTDDQGLTVSCPQNALVAGESMVCTAASSAAAGQHVNIAKVVGTPPGGSAVEDSDPANYLGRTPGIDIEKLVNGQDADTPPGPKLEAGSKVVWTYVVTNTGQIALDEVTVTDNRGVVVTCPKTAPITLAPGESMTCTASGTAISAASRSQAGAPCTEPCEVKYSNIGTAVGTPGSGGPVSDEDPAHYYTCGGDEGCSPGYWKNHAGSWPPTGYSPSQQVSTVFNQAGSHYPGLGDDSLLKALAYDGGSGDWGAAETLLRVAVAAVLNASHPGVAYPHTPAAVIADVNSALHSESRSAMLALAGALDHDNNQGCPLD